MRRTSVTRSSAARRRCAAAATLVVLASLAACTGSDGSGGSDGNRSNARTGRANPLRTADGGIGNVTFYYQGSTPLERGQDPAKLGRPAVLVTTPKADEKSAVSAIHSTGAKAYRYVQFYWAPDDEAYEGVNLAKHPDWAFCRNGDTPAPRARHRCGRHKGGLAFHRCEREGGPLRSRPRAREVEGRGVGRSHVRPWGRRADQREECRRSLGLGCCFLLHQGPL